MPVISFLWGGSSAAPARRKGEPDGASAAPFARLSSRLDWYWTLSPPGRAAFWATFGGWAIDAYNQMTLGFVLPALTAAFALSTTQAGLLGTVSLVTNAVGGALAGALADAVGRVRPAGHTRCLVVEGEAMRTNEGSSYAWLSGVMVDPRRLRPFTHDLVDNEDDLDRVVATIKRNDGGEPLGPEAFPKAIWGAAHRGARKFGKLPDIIYGYGYYAVSTRCTDVLQRFDLGGGALYPVKVLQKDKTTPIGGHDWFCINFGNVKRAFVAELSQNIEPWPGGRWAMRAALRDNDTVLSESALGGADIWIDPQLDQSLFVSGLLGDALKKEKCASGWDLTKCRVVEQ
jgi:hypothetical protein